MKCGDNGRGCWITEEIMNSTWRGFPAEFMVELGLFPLQFYQGIIDIQLCVSLKCTA